jgi:hypothetical protein
MAIAAWSSLDLAQLSAADFDATRRSLKTAGMAGVEGFCLAALAYCVFWQLRSKRITSP